MIRGSRRDVSPEESIYCLIDPVMALIDQCESSQWAILPNYSRYLIGDCGEIISLVHNKPKKLKLTGSLRYYKTTFIFTDSGEKKGFYIHRLVALAFLGQCPEGMEVCHLDGVKSNNRVANLRYATRKENHADKRRHMTSPDGERHPQAKLTWSKVRAIRAAAKLMSQRKLCQIYQVSPMTISRIVNNKSWIER